MDFGEIIFLAMTMREQVARTKTQATAWKLVEVMPSNLDEIDATLTAQLKKIVAFVWWPTIALVGIDASNGALLMLTHSHDHASRLSLLPLLEKLANANKIDGSALATVIDVVDFWRKATRLCGAIQIVDGKMEMYVVEHPAGLDSRRERMFLPPIDAYKQLMSEMDHLQVTDQIAMPEARQPWEEKLEPQLFEVRIRQVRVQQVKLPKPRFREHRQGQRAQTPDRGAQ